jgi:hypothetical protein
MRQETESSQTHVRQLQIPMEIAGQMSLLNCVYDNCELLVFMAGRIDLLPLPAQRPHCRTQLLEKLCCQDLQPLG